MWQPIETAPRDGSLIIGGTLREHPEPHMDTATMQWEGSALYEQGFWAYSGFVVRPVDENDLPTHWMPLPDPPSSDPCPDNYGYGL